MLQIIVSEVGRITRGSLSSAVLSGISVAPSNNEFTSEGVNKGTNCAKFYLLYFGHRSSRRDDGSQL